MGVELELVFVRNPLGMSVKALARWTLLSIEPPARRSAIIHLFAGTPQV